MWKIPLLLPYITVKMSTGSDTTVISDAILDLKIIKSTVNVESECYPSPHYQSGSAPIFIPSEL